VNRRTAVVTAVVCVSLCLAPLAFAFDLGIGIKAGVVSPWYEGAHYEAFLEGFSFYRQPDFGLSAGLFCTLGLTNFICLQPEAFFSMLGGRGGDDWSFWEDQAFVIDVHLLLRLRFTAKRLMFYPFCGPTVFLEMGQKSFRVVDKYSNETLVTGYWNDEFVRVPVFGVAAGAGVEVPGRRITWSLDLRYNHALQSRFTEASSMTDTYQRSVQLMMGLAWVVVGSGPRTSRTR
jgi:hypothetical protein